MTTYIPYAAAAPRPAWLAKLLTDGSQLIQSTSQLCMAMMRDDQHSAVSLAFGHQQLVVWQQQLQL